MTKHTTDTIQTVKYTWTHTVLDATRKRIFPYIQSSAQTNKLMGHSVIVTYQYDNYGNPISIVKTYANGPTETTTTTFENIVTPKWLLGRPTAISIQSTGGGNTITRAGTRVYATNSNNLNTETWFAGTNNQIVDSYIYSPKGLLKWKTSTANGASRSTTYLYSSDSIRVSNVYGSYYLDFIAYSYDAYGRIHTTRDYTDNFVTHQYDDFGRPQQATTTTGRDATLSFRWEDPTAEPQNIRYSIVKSGIDGSINKSWYDKLGRERAHGVTGFDGTWIYINKNYNLKGQIDSISDPYYPTETVLWNSFIYDDYGRRISLTRPSGRLSTWTYNANTVTENTDNKTYSKTYSTDGTVASASDPGGTLSYTYYPDGNVKTITAPGSLITSLQYDIAGNQTQLVDPSAGTINSTFDGFRQLTYQENSLGQTTQFIYHSDGRLNQKIQSLEGTTTYNYYPTMELANVVSPGNIKRRFIFDIYGRVTSIIDSIPGSSNLVTSLTFDTKGRVRTITHPSGIVETKNYNSYGYLSSIDAGGKTRWTTSTMNSRQQITGGIYGGNLNTSREFDDYGYLKSMVTGTIQDYSYNFDPVSGNLNSRQNKKYSGLTEDFTYDNLNRLDNVSMGGTLKLDMAYQSNNGGIATKTDVGTMQYASQGKPYAVSTINPATSLTPSNTQTINNTSFGMICTLSENNYKDTITYNFNHERVKMIVYQGSNHVTTRWYQNSAFMKESTSSGVKTYTYIGGDAYSAPCVAVREGTTKIRFYYLLRDHLGSITHIIDSTNNQLFEYSYDAWGRKRDPTTWGNYNSGSDTSFTRRGFTGHEQLPWFNLINMNGRAYDPLIGQFISPDKYTQDPYSTQNYNHYLYCLNNPLRFNDPSGFVKQAIQSTSIDSDFFEEFLEAYVKSQGNLDYALNCVPHISETAYYDNESSEFTFYVDSHNTDASNGWSAGNQVHPGVVNLYSQRVTVHMAPIQFNSLFVNNRPGVQGLTDPTYGGDNPLSGFDPSTSLKTTTTIYFPGIEMDVWQKKLSHKGGSPIELVSDAKNPLGPKSNIFNTPLGKFSYGIDGSCTYGSEIIRFGSTADGRFIVNLSIPLSDIWSIGITSYYNREGWKYIMNSIGEGLSKPHIYFIPIPVPATARQKN